MDSYYTTTSTTGLDGGALAIAGATIVLFVILAIIIYVVCSIFLGMLFKKAGVSPGLAWIPVYNNWKILEIGGQPGFWAILGVAASIIGIIPILGWFIAPPLAIAAMVFSVIAMHNINLKLGYGGGMTALAIFMPIIWLIVVGTSKNQWNDSLGAPRKDVAAGYPQQQYVHAPQQQPYAPQQPVPPAPAANDQQTPPQPPVA